MASSSNDSVKRKRTCVTLKTKLAILDWLKKGESQSWLISEYGIGKSTEGDIKKNEAKIKSFALTMDSLDMSKKQRKVMQLAAWRQARPSSFPLVCTKTKPKPTSERSCFVWESDANACADPHGRLHATFSRQQGLALALLQSPWHQTTVTTSRTLSSDASEVEPFKEQLQQLMEIKNFTLNNFYNCNETGLSWLLNLRKWQLAWQSRRIVLL